MAKYLVLKMVLTGPFSAAPRHDPMPARFPVLVACNLRSSIAQLTAAPLGVVRGKNHSTPMRLRNRGVLTLCLAMNSLLKRAPFNHSKEMLAERADCFPPVVSPQKVAMARAITRISLLHPQSTRLTL